MEVFVVEDEKMIRELYRDALSVRGHELVGTASTGDEAVATIRNMERTPELIIMDHRMPGMSGLNAAREILEIDPEVKIVLVSADDNAVWESMKLGIFGMKKPFNIGDLMRSLEISVSGGPPSGAVDLSRRDPILRDNGLYLIDESDGDRGIELFKELLEDGREGMAFTREHPSKLSVILGDHDVPVVWFSSSPAKDVTCISPLNIQKMLIMIQSVISRSERSVFYVGGFEYVLTNLQFERVLNLVQVLNDRVMSTGGSIVIFSLDLDVLDERQRRLLSKELIRP
ncbi:MAG: DUF835 domain-containing protein [Thermoplasmatota archaeon]